ncbi:MAG: sugar ABC transporter permease [Clostridia bacterium]|nr:sugar ABC transporter permease [Clostridia bacterium]
MIILPVIYIIIFAYYPMYGLQIAFRKFNPALGIMGSPWAGMQHFRRFFNSPQFGNVIVNTLVLSFYNLAAGVPIPIILALGLNAMRNKILKKTVQMATYLPHFISSVVMVGMLIQMFSPRVGMFGNLYSLMTGQLMQDINASPKAFVHMYVWSGIWQNMGWSSIIYLAALSNVDSEQTEAALIDGTTRLQRVWYIDFPAIVPTAVILLIMNAGQMMNVGVEKVLLMQNNLNISTSEVISTYSYKAGLSAGGGDFSYGTAIGMFNSVINLILLVVVNGISKRVSDTSLW